MTDGIVTKASPRSVDETVRRLIRILDAKELTVFSIVDHSGEAKQVGLEMPNTKLVIFGNPAGGTPIMLAAPLAALDLPLKLLVWEDADGAVWISYNTAEYLAHRYQLDPHLEAPLAAIEAISETLVAEE
jgi:uncharacterized protein (DUF302 family)